MKTIYIGIGSNVGSRYSNIKKALTLLKENKIKVNKISSMYETSPVGITKQNWFINCVAECETSLSADKIVAAFKKVESKLGRKKTIKWGPRIIDIDLLLYDKRVINEKKVIVPHPYLHLRRFVMEPLIEVNGRLKHPVLKIKISEILNNISNKDKVKKINKRDISTGLFSYN